MFLYPSKRQIHKTVSVTPLQGGMKDTFIRKIFQGVSFLWTIATNLCRILVSISVTRSWNTKCSDPDSHWGWGLQLFSLRPKPHASFRPPKPFAQKPPFVYGRWLWFALEPGAALRLPRATKMPHLWCWFVTICCLVHDRFVSQKLR